MDSTRDNPESTGTPELVPPPTSRWRRLSSWMPGAMAVVGLTALATALRLWRLPTDPIWSDEASTWHASRASLWEFLTWRHHFEHPPLSFMLVRATRELVGSDAEPVLRLPSLLAGIACAPLAYALGRSALRDRSAGRRLGVWLGVMTACSPILIAQSGQARMYTLAAVFSLLALIVLARTARKDAWGAPAGVLIGLCAAGAIWTSNLGWVLLGALAITLLITSPGGRRAAVTGDGDAPVEDTQGRQGMRRRGLVTLLAMLATAILLSLPGFLKLADRAADGDVPIDALRGEQHGRPFPAAVAGALDAGLLNAFEKDEFTSLLLLGAGAAGLALLARRSPPLGVALAVLAGAVLVAVTVTLLYHPFLQRRYFLLMELSLYAGVASLAALPRGAKRRWAGAAFAVVIAAWGGIQAAGEPPGPLHDSGRLLRALAGRMDARDATIYQMAYLKRLGEYYRAPHPLTRFDLAPSGDASSPPPWPMPAHLDPPRTFVLVGHLPDGRRADAPDTRTALDLLESAAAHYGLPLDRRRMATLLAERHGIVLIEFSAEGIVVHSVDEAAEDAVVSAPL